MTHGFVETEPPFEMDVTVEILRDIGETYGAIKHWGWFGSAKQSERSMASTALVNSIAALILETRLDGGSEDAELALNVENATALWRWLTEQPLSAPVYALLADEGHLGNHQAHDRACACGDFTGHVAEEGA